MSDKAVYLRVHVGGAVSFIGSWGMPGPLIDNYTNQESVGWHIFLSLQRGADKVEVVYGDQDADYKSSLLHSEGTK